MKVYEAIVKGLEDIGVTAAFRRAVPHYSPSPDGLVAGLVEAVEARLRAAINS